MSKKQEAWPMVDTSMLRSMGVMNGHAAEAATRAAEICARSIESVPTEMLRFTAQRLRDDANAFKACSHCDTLADLMEQQRSWMQETTRAYMDESTRLMSLGQEMFAALGSGEEGGKSRGARQASASAE